MKRATRWAAALSLSGLLVGLVGFTPVKADAQEFRLGYSDNNVIVDLQFGRDYAYRHHDWDAVRRYDYRIADWHRHHGFDRRDDHRDFDRDYRDTNYRDRDSHFDRERERDSHFRRGDNRDNRDYRGQNHDNRDSNRDDSRHRDSHDQNGNYGRNR